MIVYKHHISKHFEEDPSLLKNNGVGIGGTIFLNYDFMVKFLKEHTRRRWHYAKLKMKKSEFVVMDFVTEDRYMATSLVKRKSREGFKPLEETQYK